MSVTALAPWFGSNRLLAEHVGKALDGCNWVGVPFAGSMTELRHIGARTLLVNDLHWDIINLAMCVRDDRLRELMLTVLDHSLFHPAELMESRAICDQGDDLMPSHQRAAAYFICVWMGRSGKAGTDGEFRGKIATRWNASGGDSNVRFRSAVEAIRTEWPPILKRCTFECMHCFDFLGKCKDQDGHGIYCDPPFPDVGEDYLHKFSEEEHRRLAQRLMEYRHTKVVCRFYDHPLIRCLYPECNWDWRFLKGRDQANDRKPEVLIVRRERLPSLF